MRVLFLLPLLLLLIHAPALPAHGGEPSPPPPRVDAEEVAKLLLSPDAADRERGAKLLLARIRQGGDAAAFVAAMAKKQVEWADAEDRLIDRWIDDALTGTPEGKDRARRLLAALGPKGTQRLLARLQTLRTTQVPPVGPPQATVPRVGSAPASPQSPDAGPSAVTPPPGNDFVDVPGVESVPQVALPLEPVEFVPLAWTVFEVPTEEISGWLGKQENGASEQTLAHGEAVVLLESVPERLEHAARLPEARVRGTQPAQVVALDRWMMLVAGEEVPYRSRVRPTKGAWAVETDVLHRGLGVDVRVEREGDGYEVTLAARFTHVPQPLPTERVRPAENVEPMELDRPEWESASLTVPASLSRTSDRLVAFFPGLVPDRVVVVGLRIPAPIPVLEK